MKILITGVTGFIGRRLCQVLSEAGHTLIALSRDPCSARNRVPQLAAAFSWAPALPEAFAGVEAVIHLAGESIAGRWSAAKKQAIYNSRVIGTRCLVNALTQLSQQPKALISASAIDYYGDRGEEILTEESAPGSGFFTQICQDWEREATKAQELGLRVVCLRIGLVLGPGGGALQAMLPIFKLGLGGPLGSGRQWWSWVHRDDVVGLIAYTLEKHDMSGPVNVTAPQAIRQRDFAQILGRVLRRPAFLPVSGFALKLVLGELSEGLLSSKRVIPERAQAMDYRFRFPGLEPALRDVLLDNPSSAAYNKQRAGIAQR